MVVVVVSNVTLRPSSKLISSIAFARAHYRGGGFSEFWAEDDLRENVIVSKCYDRRRNMRGVILVNCVNHS